MNTKRITLRLVAATLMPILVSASNVRGQGDKREKSQRTVIRYGNIIEIGDFVSIPEATEPCTPEELMWWERIRSAHAEMLLAYKKRKWKALGEAQGKFFLLLYDGEQKAYRVPLQDGPPLILVTGMLIRPYLAIKHGTSGTVELSADYRKDGSVGDIRVVTWLGDGWTQNSIEAVRQNVFLPAVKDRAFVDYKQSHKFVFKVYNRF